MYKLNNGDYMNKRYNLLKYLIFILFSLITLKLFYIQIIKNDYYKEELINLTTKIIEGDSTPRGRIYDRNGVLLVDNKPVKTIYYKKKSNISYIDEVKTAYLLSKLIDVDYSKLTENDIKKFWIVNNRKESSNRITKDEWNLFNYRKITESDIEKLKLDRVSGDDIKGYTDEDREAIYIYTLMNSGYSYNDKIIKNVGVTDLEYALVGENIEKLNGIDVRLDWDRVYLYDDVFRTILGSISQGIPYESKDKYLSMGYGLNDRIGTSYIEYQYENFLKGIKPTYILKNNVKTYKTMGKRGNDIVLTIDIELQEYVEKVLEEELKKSKYEYNTDYFNKSYVIIMEPSTGEILAMAGEFIEGDKVYDYTPGIITSSVTPGSIVKGASHIVGYNNKALYIGETRYDECIKIAATKEKCSYENLGYVDDLTALKISSNVFQFLTAINVGGGYYCYNCPLKLNEEAFDIYRNTFKEFGLGAYTKIDLPNEKLGYEGTEELPGLLLDFSIGQYDTYTPIEIAQYMATIANSGSRMQPHILKAVFDSNKPFEKLLYEFKPRVLNKVTTEEKYINRVQKGLKMVMEPGGTGYNYVDSIYNPAGKTGTSQSFLDTDGDGKIDTGTITSTFSSYAPFYDPRVVFTVISPDVAVESRSEYGISNVNKRITQKVSKKYFEIY